MSTACCNLSGSRSHQLDAHLSNLVSCILTYLSKIISWILTCPMWWVEYSPIKAGQLDTHLSNLFSWDTHLSRLVSLDTHLYRLVSWILTCPIWSVGILACPGWSVWYSPVQSGQLDLSVQTGQWDTHLSRLVTWILDCPSWSVGYSPVQTGQSDTHLSNLVSWILTCLGWSLGYSPVQSAVCQWQCHAVLVISVWVETDRAQSEILLKSFIQLVRSITSSCKQSRRDQDVRRTSKRCH